MRFSWLQQAKMWFNTELGRRYQLERSLDLTSRRWTPVGLPGTAAPVITGTGGTMAVSDSTPPGPTGFYRITLLPE